MHGEKEYKLGTRSQFSIVNTFGRYVMLELANICALLTCECNVALVATQNISM